MTDREKVERHLFRSEGYAHLPAGMRADLLDIIMADVFKPEPVTEAELWRFIEEIDDGHISDKAIDEKARELLKRKGKA